MEGLTFEDSGINSRLVVLTPLLISADLSQPERGLLPHRSLVSLD